MDSSPRPPLIDYATPPAASPAGRAPVVLGTIAGVLGIGAPLACIAIVRLGLARFRFVSGLCASGDVFALILGGIGWDIARRSRPNAGYLLCSIVNTLNWLGLAASLILPF